MKVALVTGANGFVGRAICKELSSQGIQVKAIIRKNGEYRNLDKLEGVEIIQCDLDNIDSLSNLFDKNIVDCFYHLAWNGSAGSLRGDYNAQLKNLKAACEAVEVCHRIECPKFLFASSIMEYEIEVLMQTEMEAGINSLYSVSKVAADYMTRIISGKYGIEYIRCVISNIYGPGESSPRLINTSIKKLINGEHCSFSEGLQMYDFIYIDDAARIFVALGDKGINNRTYYIGSKTPHRLKDYLLEMRDIVAPNMEIGLGELPFNGVSLSYKEFDIDAVEKDTGVVPRISFAEGIGITKDWIIQEDKCGRV